MIAALPIPLDWPFMEIELRCSSCKALIFSECVRPAILTPDAFPRLSVYWRSRMLEHVEQCRERPAPTRGAS